MNKFAIMGGELLTVLLLFCTATARAESFSVETSGTTFYYNILSDESPKTVEVTYYAVGANTNSTAYTGSLTIPATVTYNSDTYSVTRIGERAFNGCSGITSVSLPSSITCIRDSAFAGCSGLTTVTFDGTSGLTTIENKAFSGCSKLSSISLPSSVTSLGEYAFYGCSALTSVEVPSGVTSIGQNTFAYSGLTSITIPDNVSSIGMYAFSNCASLSSFTIPSSVETIGGYAFSNCTSLPSITIPSSVTSLGALVFQQCTALTKIVVNESNANYCSIDSVLFTKSGTELMQYPLGSSLTAYEVPDAVTTIDSRAFAYCASDLASVTLGDAVQAIGSNAFYSCKGLAMTSLGSAVSELGNYAFRYCSSLAEVYNFASAAATCGTKVFDGLPSEATLYVLADNVNAFSGYDGDGCGWDYFTVASTLSIPVTGEEDSSTYYGTYYNSACGYTMPEALTGYTVTIKDENIVALNKAYESGSTVPAGIALLLRSSSSGTYSANIATDGGTSAEDNMLYGSDTAATTTGPDGGSYRFYKLSYDSNDENLGFYWGADNGVAFTSLAHKAWLVVPYSEGSTIKFTGFSLGDADETTGLQTVEAATITDGMIYNIAGQRVNNMNRRGVYIVNGKKVIRK